VTTLPDKSVLEMESEKLPMITALSIPKVKGLTVKTFMFTDAKLGKV